MVQQTTKWINSRATTIRYSGFHALFALATEGMSAELKWLPPMRLVVEDLARNMVKLLVKITYHIPLDEFVGLQNVRMVLELVEKLEVGLQRGSQTIRRG
ncbi:hypothetical protein MRX96_031824 [Rhipicephalus microplus]